MTREKIIADAIEAAMEVAINSPHNNNAVTLFDCALATSAAAVLDLCGPKELMWEEYGGTWRAEWYGGHAAYTHDHDDVALAIWAMGKSRPDRTRQPNAEAAQAAAQAHAEAAHWAGTKLGETE